MSTFGGFNFTGLNGVNLKNTAIIRVESDGISGTLAVKESEDSARAWYFPSKSGTFPIMGTFSVDMPIINAGAFGETAITVSGIRVEDGLVCTLQNGFGTVTTSRGQAIITGANAQNGYIYLTFFNFGTTATIPSTVTVAYVAVR